jgi:hypothetical protein
MSQRSPINFWLLLAATACVNAVAYGWARSSSEHGTIVWFGLLSGQLSAVCIWSSFRPRPNWRTRLFPVGAVFAASLAHATTRDIFLQVVPYFATFTAALLASLWVLRRSAYWQRRWNDHTKWQFSMAQLLLLSTIVCVLAAALRSVNLYEGELGLVTGLFASSVVLAILSTVIASTSAHWLLRLAGVAATAIVCSAIFYWWVDGFMFMFVQYQLLAQTIVLAAWLEWGHILPIRPLPTSGNAAAEAVEPSSPPA